MKHNFEKWLEEKYDSKLLSHMDSNTEAIKKLFNESMICHKSSAYRAAIIMAMNGFNMIMRDRLLKYKDSLEKTDNSIYFNDKKLTDDNGWDMELGNFIITNKKNFDKIFPNKSDWHNDWSNYRIMRNRAAHGKSFELDYYNVEVFYSWIMQAFNMLYPVTALETLLEDITIFFDISKTPDDKPYDYIINNSLYISSEEELEKIIFCLYEIYISNINNNKLKLKVINLLSELFNNKKNIFLNVINEFIKNYLSNSQIEEDEEDRKYHYSEFVKDLLYNNVQISLEIDNEAKYFFLKNAFFVVTDYDKLYEKKIIDKELILEKLKRNDFYYLYQIEKDKVKYIEDLIDIEIERRCKLLLISNSYDSTRNILSKIPNNFLNEKHVAIIREAYKTNNQVSDERYKVPPFMEYIERNFGSDEKE